MSESVFNEGSIDVDFRIEGNGSTHAFFVEGETDRVGLLTSDPTHTLVVKTDSSGSVNVFKIEEKDSTDALVHASFANSHDEGSVGIYYGGTLKNYFRGNGDSYITGGSLGIGTTTIATDPANIKLKVAGAIEAGHVGTTNGCDYLYGAYSNDDRVNTIGSLYSSGMMFMGFGVKARNGESGFNSSADNISWARSAVGVDGVKFFTTGAVSASEGSSVTVPERMRITSAGQVGIGTASPESQLTFSTQAYTTSADNGIRVQNPDTTADAVIQHYENSDLVDWYIGSNAYVNTSGGQVRYNTSKESAAINISAANGHIFFATNGTGANPTSRMLINNTGSVLIGTSTRTATGVGGASFDPNSVGRCLLLLGSVNYTSSVDVARFYNDNGEVGDIRTDGSGASFNSNSDYRLKENEVVLSNALTRLNNLKPYRFNFKADANRTLDGFFAHEVQEVVPEAVTGIKDQMKAIQYQPEDDIPEGKEVYDIKEYSTTEIDPQKMDASKLVPLLVAAVQELSEKVEALENA